MDSLEGARPRVLVVSDSLPYAIRLQRGGEPVPERRRRRSYGSYDSLPIDFGEEVGGLVATDIGVGSSFDFKERHHHVALWVGRQLEEFETIYVGKPAGVDPKVYEGDLMVAAHLRESYFTQKSCVPVLLPANTLHGHWEGYCQTTLRPLLHYTQAEACLDGRKQLAMWNDYVKVNEAFADSILAIWQPGDIVWILDYQLFLLPELLRKRVSDMIIGLYVRSPFPSSELFRSLPESQQILSGMLGANVIGFQTYGYSRHFTSSCMRILGVDTTPKGVDNEGVLVDVVVHPIGIDAEAVRRIASREGVRQRAETLRELSAGKRIILGLDAMDQSRGILHKLRALEKAFQMYPELVGKIVLMQIILPGPEETSKVDGKVNEMTSRINSTFGSLDYTPVQILHQDVEADEYYSLLAAADVLLVTSERESVNTVVLDYIACQNEHFGVPILSEFTGLTGFLPANYTVNPWNYAGVASIINEVISMTSEEKRIYHARLMDFAERNTVQRWVEFFLYAIEASISLMGAHIPTQMLTLDTLLGWYVEAERRIFFLDYDGTLMPIQRVPSAAAPSPEIIKTLRMLTADPSNSVYVISGRDQKTLESWLGHIPRLGLSAEHGCFLRTIQEPIENPTWISMVDLQELHWHQDVLPIMEYYTERTPGSFIEVKTVSITWHYRLADPEFGSWQAKEVKTHLDHTVASRNPVEVVAGKKNVEVRPKSCNKGEIVKMILERHGKSDFIFCSGDDRTDEDMFRGLAELYSSETSSPLAMSLGEGREWCFTCSVGPAAKKTAAKYRVSTPDQLVSLLMRLGSMLSERAGGLTL